MDVNNWMPAAPGGEASVDQVDWRTQLDTDLRQRVVDRIMETLIRNFSCPEGSPILKNIAVEWEERFYMGASSQTDYMEKISFMLVTVENALQNTGPSNPASNIDRLPDMGASYSLPSQVQNQPQAHQQLMSQYVENNMAPGGVQSSAGLGTSLPYVSGVTQSPMANVVGLNSNMQIMPSILQASASVFPDAESDQVNADDWQEEAYQKIVQMKEKYLPGLTELFQKVATKLQKLDSQQPESDQIVKLEKLMRILDHIFRVLYVPKSSISPDLKEKLVIYEKQIQHFLSAIRLREPKQQALAQPKEPLPSPSELTHSCPICLGPLVNQTTTKCGHVFCEKCINTALTKQSTCPICRSPVVAEDLIRLYLGINIAIGQFKVMPLTNAHR